VFAAIALLCWLPEARKANAAVAARQPDEGGRPIWRSALAWQITVFMGLQFLIYYVTIAWMPVYLADHGLTLEEAGWLLTLYQVVSFGVGFVAPALSRRPRDQRPLAVVASLVTALSVLGLMAVPSLAGLWLLVCGVSFGITFILAFALIGMRTSDHRQAVSLSTLSQGTAYVIAATGPVAFGWLRDLTTGWTVPMVSLLAVTITQGVAGFGAGRPGQV
jgi:CP family cyanate transporter-like MFS transporter